MFNSIFFWFQFYSPGASIIMGLHYCHIMLDFCEVNSVLRVFFWGGGGEGGFSVSGKAFLGSFRNGLFHFYPYRGMDIRNSNQFLPWISLT